MHSSLWGPPLWQAIFASAWAVNASTIDALRALLLEQLPALLPCETCRNNYARHIPKVNQRAHGAPKSANGHAMRWCWYLKHEVNGVTGHSSIPLAEVVDRYVLHGANVDEVALADVLVLVAFTARSLNRDDLYISMCGNLSELLGLAEDSALRQNLAVTQRPVINAALRCARQTRLQHGRPTFVLAHYRAVAA